ncbi:MAG TPA: hypothetical protein VFH06_02350 [Candidatus Saccharimonadales bacterium]|nr:hypothetical protein [Candidatus Saccharimonadales bacterium]
MRVFTSEELYEVCRRILLESSGTYYYDAHYFRIGVEGETARLSNYMDVFVSGFQQNEDQEAQRLELLQQDAPASASTVSLRRVMRDT